LDWPRRPLLTCESHTRVHRAFQLNASTLLNLCNQLDAWRKPERFEQFLQVCEADAHGRTGLEQSPYPQADYCRAALREALTITAQDMIALGLQGAAIRAGLDEARAAHLQQRKNQPDAGREMGDA